MDASTSLLRMSVSDLPTLNAILNSVAALFLLIGYQYIRAKKIEQHRICMIAAFACSILFLASYLTYHALAGSKHFQGTGAVRTIYFTILLTHTVLAAAVPPLAIITLYRAWKGQYEKHRRIARWTFPIWVYVSVTGVVVYWMLYRMVW
jgi:putative membrane protein